MKDQQTFDCQEQFDEIIEDTLAKIKEVLITKGKEYRRNNDVFHNFNEGARITGQTREEVLWGFALKHFISIQDIKNDIKLGLKKPTKELLDEKYGDLINYLLLEKASIIIGNNLYIGL